MGTHSKENIRAGQDVDRGLRRSALLWERLYGLLSEEMTNGMEIREVRIQGPLLTGNDTRLIIKGVAGGEKFIAFQNAETVEDAVKQMVSRLDQDTMKWKEDLPYDRYIKLRDGRNGDGGEAA